MATKEPRVKRKKVDERDLVAAVGGDPLLEVAERYGCGPIRFSGTADALYERHLTFDDVVPVADAGPRERFEAVARSVRDLLSQRWIYTEQTYTRANPKRVYYLSMEFLLGRSLANNVTNLRIARTWSASRRRSTSIGSSCSSRSRTPASATAGSAAWPPASSTRWRRCRSRPWATGCATNMASSASRSRTAGSRSSRTTGCTGRIPGRLRVRASR